MAMTPKKIKNPQKIFIIDYTLEVNQFVLIQDFETFKLLFSWNKSSFFSFCIVHFNILDVGTRTKGF